MPFRGGKPVTLAGLITDVRKRNNRVTMYLDDGEERVEMSMYAETWQGFKHLLEERSIRVVSGKLRFEEYIDGWRLNVTDVKDIDRVIEQRATGLVIRWLERGGGQLSADELRQLLGPHRPGRCGVEVVYIAEEARARLALGDAWRVRPTGELREKLAELLGVEAFRFDYQEHRGQG